MTQLNVQNIVFQMNAIKYIVFKYLLLMNTIPYDLIWNPLKLY